MSQTARRRVRLSLLLALADAAAAAPAADQALLIGVSEYPALDEDAQLQGPLNDVQLMRDALLRRGFDPAKIQVLADGVDGAGLPTRAAILTALDHLAGRLSDRDRLYLHLSGHATQQPNLPDRADSDADPDPDLDPDQDQDHEWDGLDEVFLPRDAAGWDAEIGRVRKGIIDDEIGARIGRLQSNGAFVWLVADTCPIFQPN